MKPDFAFSIAHTYTKLPTVECYFLEQAFDTFFACEEITGTIETSKR